MKEEMTKLKKEFKLAAKVIIITLCILWGLFIVDALLFNNKIKENGIHPRDIKGLYGILISPFLHSTIPHILDNSVALLFIGSLVIFRSISEFFCVSGIAMLVSGLGTWIIGGNNTNHIGFSGILFGYLGYLLTTGIFEKKIGAIVLSLFTLTTYGGLVFRILPTQPGVSWEGHLFGFVGGIISAKVLGDIKKTKKSNT